MWKKVRNICTVSLIVTMLLVWTPALAQEEEDPVRVFFDGGTGPGYRYTDPSGKDLGCKFGDSFNIDIDIYFWAIELVATKQVYLIVEKGDGATETSYESNTVSGVIFNPSSPVTVQNSLLYLPLDPSDPHEDVTVTIPLAGLSSGVHYYRVHVYIPAGGAHNLYFSFETDCASAVPEFGDLSIATSLGAISTVATMVLLRRRLGIPSRL